MTYKDAMRHTAEVSCDFTLRGHETVVTLKKMRETGCTRFNTAKMMQLTENVFINLIKAISVAKPKQT